MKYKTIVFDLDGTLLNTLDDLADSVNYALRTNNLPERTIDEIRRFIGNGVRILMRRAVGDKVTEEVYQKAFRTFEEHYRGNSRNKTAPYPGVLKMLGELKTRGYKLAIVSNKIDFAVKDLREEFFFDVIDVAIGDSEDTNNKPEPDMVYKALRELGASVEDAVYVGDTDVDLETAKNSGMDAICVSWGFRSRDELEGYNAPVIIDTAEEIYRYI